MKYKRELPSLFQVVIIVLFFTCFQVGQSFAGTATPAGFTANLHELTGEVDLSWQYPGYEDFDDGTADEFTPVNCNWSVGSGVYLVSNSRGTSTCSASLNEVYSDFEFSVDLIKHKGYSVFARHIHWLYRV